MNNKLQSTTKRRFQVWKKRWMLPDVIIGYEEGSHEADARHRWMLNHPHRQPFFLKEILWTPAEVLAIKRNKRPPQPPQQKPYLVYLDKTYGVWLSDAIMWAMRNGRHQTDFEKILSESEFWDDMKRDLLDNVPVYFVKDIDPCD